MKIKLIIVDDNSFVSEGMKIILSTYEEFEVLNILKDGQKAIDYCQNNSVDIALLDVRMPNVNGVEATKIITETTDTNVLILTTFDDDEYILDAVRNGAKGYLLKNNDPGKIKDAIISIYNGNTVMQNVVLEKIKDTITKQKIVDTTKEECLDKSIFTEREFDVIKAIAKGYSNKEISKELFISEGTVANYISSILSKTYLEHRTQIAIYYLKGNIK